MSDFGTAVVNPAPLAPWRSPLARAIYRNRSRPHSRYGQLATVAINGRPTNRTVVFRGFYDRSNALMFVTDGRSAKVKDLAHSPWGELCWYFTLTREQFRLAGAILLVTADTADPALLQARQERWESLSEASRQSFYWPTPAERRREDPAAFEVALDISKALNPPPTFCLGLLQPDGVDHLELRGDPQTRTQYQSSGGGQWTATTVNP